MKTESTQVQNEIPNTEQKSRDKRSKAEQARFETKAPMINQAWAEEVVATLGITGPMGKAIASELVSAIGKMVAKQTSRAKVTKLLLKALAQTIV